MNGGNTKRVVIETVVVLLVLGGFAAALGAGVGFWQSTETHHWYSLPVAIALGFSAALAAWFLAAIVSLAVEIADGIRTLVSLTAAGKEQSA